MRALTVTVLIGFVLITGIALAAGPAEHRDSATSTLRVHITGDALRQGFGDAIYGPGIPSTNPRVVECPRGSVRWQKRKEMTDPSGVHHVFYQLVIRPGSALAENLSSRYAEGIPINGIELGFHYTPQGPLLMIQGHQLERFETVNRAVVGDEYQAYVLAQDQLDADPRYELDDRLTWSQEMIDQQIAHARLVAEPAGDGTSFRFVWEVPSITVSGESIVATMDAGDGRILGTRRTDPMSLPYPNPNRECQKDEDGARVGGPVYALEGRPVVIPSPTAYASVLDPLLSDFPEYPYQAYDPGLGYPPIVIWMGLHENQFCPTAAYNPHRVIVPVDGTVGGIGAGPTWNQVDDLRFESVSPTNWKGIPGAVAGTASFNTRTVMNALQNILRLNGIDDNGMLCQVVVDAYHVHVGGRYNSAQFGVGTSNISRPEDSVVIYPAEDLADGTNVISLATALDVVAHEWFHGVEKHIAGWHDQSSEPTDELPDQHNLYIAEGLADVFGHAVEWWENGAPTDWYMGEDSNKPHRRADDPDCGRCISYRLHMDDSSNNSNSVGNLLAVVQYLLTEGGTNPHCNHTDPSEWPSGLDCSISVTPLETDRFQAMRGATYVLLRTVFYMDTSPSFQELVNAATCTTWHEFYRCRTEDPSDPNCGVLSDSLDEQDAVMDAFEAVGIPFTRQYCDPGSQSPICCAQQL